MSNGSLASRGRGGALACSILALTCLAATACSPWSAAVEARVAQHALRVAEQTGARELAAYEYTLARLYLDKAREEAGEAHYAFALKLLQRSQRSAHKARTVAEARAVQASATPQAREVER